ncbi:hypothetical protein [Streptomyces sp. NPDC047108]|uniref:hypothetical protein n=1 Tax=Streptomyces sp. NPDC047108 TaxID=3155025 RepID=UPI0033ECE28F
MYDSGRMVKVNVALIVLLLLFVAVLGIRALIGPDMAWTYDKVFRGPETGRLSDVIATADDDIWVVGNATDATDATDRDGDGDDSADDGFLLHDDGTGWERRPMPESFGRSVHEARFDAVDSGGVLLTASARDLGAPRMAHWNGTRWTPVPRLPDDPRIADVRAFAPDDIWVLGGGTRAYHWDGARWTALDLPVTAGALDGVAPDDVWAVGSRDRDPGGDPEGRYAQPAAAHWDGRAWKSVPTPGYRYGVPAPEQTAYLTEVVALGDDDVRAYGELTSVSEDDEPDPPEQGIRLRWNGTGWTKLPNAEGACAERGRAVRDGDRGSVLGAKWYRSADGDCEGIAQPELPSGGGISPDARQSLRLHAITAVPGTDTVLGVGSVDVSQGGNPTSRSVIAHLER